MNKVIVQVQMMMNAPIDSADLNLDGDDDPLPLKFKFLDMKKFNGTDPHLHLKQFVSHMRLTGLTKP